MNTADLWFRGDSFWPGALWRIPGLEIPRIEAEMRAAWDITTKFVNRRCRYNPERTYAYVEHTPPVRRRCGCGGLVPYKLAQYQPELIGLIGTTTWTAECRCGGRETVEADPPRLNSRITDTIRRTWRLDRLFVHGTGRPPNSGDFSKSTKPGLRSSSSLRMSRPCYQSRDSRDLWRHGRWRWPSRRTPLAGRGLKMLYPRHGIGAVAC